MKHKFQVGDRVVVVNDQNSTCLNIGDVGTICYVPDDFFMSLGVESDRPSQGHSCDGRCREGHGWWIPSSHIELIEEESVEDELVDLDGLL